MEVDKPKDIVLFNLCEVLFKKALGALREFLTARGNIPLMTYYEPVVHLGEDGKVQEIEYVPYEEQLFLSSKFYQILKNLPEMKTACNYIFENKYLVIGESNFSPSILLWNALSDFLKNTGSLDYQEKAFWDIYAKLENLIFNNEILFRNTAKLENFSCSKSKIEFDDVHFVKRYTQEECKEIYHHPSINIYDYTLPHPGDFKIEVLKSKDKDNWGKASIEGSHEINELLTTLRLFKDSAVSITAYETNEPITWFPFTSKAYQSLPPNTTGEVCSIEEDETPQLINLWQIIKTINYKNCPSLKIAIKRFNYAHGHKEREDALIDIMIGLEALFLREKDELSFRLSLRVAAFLEASLPLYKGEKRTIFDNVKKAYRLRSVVVHGSEVPGAKVWECRIVKKYLSDSIRLFAQLSQKYKDQQILETIDEQIKDGAKEYLHKLFS